MPIIVTMQMPSEVAARSVGENASPLPLLSTGASVINDCPDFKCVTSSLRSPMYLKDDVLAIEYIFNKLTEKRVSVFIPDVSGLSGELTIEL